MAQISLNSEQQTQLQGEVQRELERREWAEPGDNVMAEYITVLLANGSTKDRVQTEMDDLVGSDFDARFLDWLFDTAQSITSPPEPTPARSPPVNRPSAGGRMFGNAIAASSNQEKRKFEGSNNGPEQNKRRVSEGLPSGPRNMGSEGRSLADRMGPRNNRGGFAVRGMAGRGGFGGGGGHHGHMGPGGGGQGFRPMMQNPGFGFFGPQQEMMAQMMMMQANMAQMGEMMQKMQEEREAAQSAASQSSVRPPRPTPAKIPHGTKLGSHSVSVVPPKRASSPGPIPDKPSSKALCRYSVGCSNSRCPFSHPSPVADEKTGMVLSEEPCEAGKECKDPECVKSHVSPAAVHGGAAGPSRMLCKYQNCTNPSCQFRHEDADGNPIPPPALTAAKSKESRSAAIAPAAPSSTADHSDNEDGDMEVVMSSKSLMDGPLEDGKGEKQCRYGERCTRADCKFSHPPGRPTPRGAKTSFAAKKSMNGAFGSGMNVSKRFGAPSEKKLDPTVTEFKPATPA